MPINPQMMALLSALQGNQMGPAQTGVGPPQGSLGPPQATPGYMPTDSGPPQPPLAGTYDAQFPQQKGDMYNPPFTGQEATGDQADRQRPDVHGSVPPIPRSPLGALLMPSIINQAQRPVPPSNMMDWNQVTRSMLSH